MQDKRFTPSNGVFEYVNTGTSTVFVSLTSHCLRPLQGGKHCTRCIIEPCIVPIGGLFIIVGLCVAAVIWCSKFYTLLM